MRLSPEDGGARAPQKKENGLADPLGRLLLAAVGIEAEFALIVDGKPCRPESLFGNPTAFLGKDLMHRTGTSYHLKTGGAIYFDTGVIEVATPAIEIEQGCAARCGRSLWEGILDVRSALNKWEARTGRSAALAGFSAHYNVSFELPIHEQGADRSVDKLALLLVHLLPAPIMLLATNRRSTGVGVRPRGDRVEITVDFTPSPALMIATGTFIVGVTREVMKWSSFDPKRLAALGLPMIAGFHPIPHTSRQGWLAHESSYPMNPFRTDVNAPVWRLTDGSHASLRTIAGRITRRFWRPIRRVSDPFTFRMIGSVVRGRVPSLLELADRPPEYDDVGRLCTWDNLFPESVLSRSRYERVLIRAISGRPMRIGLDWYTPVRMRGWSAVEFRREKDGGRRSIPIDMLVPCLDRW